MSPAELAIASAVMLVGACLQGSIGFGMNLVAAPVLLLIDTQLVPGPTLVAAVILTVLMSLRERAHLDWRGVRWATVGRVPGTVLGAAAIVVLPGRGLTILFGALVLLAVVLSLGWRVRPTPRVLVAAGVLSAFMGTTTSIGGPPIALVYQRERGPTVRATLSAFFVIGALASILSLAVVGHFGTDELLASAALAPGLLLGYALSRPLGPMLDQGWTRVAVLVVAAGSGLTALVQGLA